MSEFEPYPLANRDVSPTRRLRDAEAERPWVRGNLWDIVRRRWLLVVAVLVPVVAATAVYTYVLAPQLYESEASFLLQSQSDAESGSPFALLDQIGRVNRVENELELLKSRRVLAPAVAELGLHVVAHVDGIQLLPGVLLKGFQADREAPRGTYVVAPGPDSATRVLDATGRELSVWEPGDTVRLQGMTWAADTVPPTEFELQVRDFEAGVKSLAAAVEVDRVGRDADMVRLTCTAGTAEMARNLCVSVSESYLELRTELRISEAANAREWLTSAAERIEDRLRAAEDSLTVFSKMNEAVALDARAQEEVRNLASLAAEQDLLEAERSALRTYLDRVRSGAGGTEKYRELANFPTFMGNEAVAGLISSLVELDNRRSDLAVLRTEANPEVAAIDERISDIERQLLSIASSYESALSAQIDSYGQTLVTGSARVASIPERQVEFLRRQRQVEQLEDMYGTLESRRREAELAEGVTMPSVRPIDEPALPLAPSSPRTRLNLALGSVLGLGLGLLLAGYREFSDIRLRSREQVELASGTTVIGMLPRVRRAGPLLVQPAEHNAHRILRQRARSGVDDGVPPGWSQLEWQPAIEAFRTLVADLKHAFQDVDGRKRSHTLAVASSAQGEGKTFTACNLALVWASMGARTLLIDADARAGRVAGFFDIPRDAPGFADVLKGEVSALQVLQQVHVTGGATLQVLTAGQLSSEATSGIHREGQVARVLQRIRQDFDLVIIDTPPLNVVSDATIMTAASDAVVFVVRSGMTRPESLEVALDRVRRINGNLVGLVLNDVELPSYYSAYYSRGA